MVEQQEEIVEQFVKRGRWFVRVRGNNHSITMPQAIYVWLKGNPAFIDIPKDYVVHHLDGDPMNDDISNLVIMQKYHHAAYHWKQKTVNPKLNLIDDFVRVNRTTYTPINEPKIYFRGDRFRIYIREKTPDGIKKGAWISQWQGKPIKTREMAEFVKAELLKLKSDC